MESWDVTLTRNYNKIQSLDRALNLLELISMHKEEIGLSELAREVGLNKTTIYRLLATMESRHFVRQSKETSKYRLGWKLVELSSKLLDGIELVNLSNEPLKQLSKATQEASHLGVLEDDEVLYINKFEGIRQIRIASRIGVRMPVHCTALGKVILAYLPDHQSESILTGKPLVRKTQYTITDPALLLKELEETRKRGYGLDNCENEDGIRCIGAPVLDNHGLVCAAVSVSGPSFRLKDALLEETIKHVKDCARSISESIGCSKQILEKVFTSQNN